ncbi:hypothetical protein LOTGIDRAFT_156580 [Lottia gigantea]|uniref:G-protein coupled receptors family 1 profile domain-containing protein n=1 Tax=Lottia gigantea TaxID=225164 RepID=V4B123_LOTGI|nr:hypothetical protein LOTGIDRAFT_156580 [Lottia gigantea]ESP03978.1 hypothetical protein LOTGIDRAFT_156580 [Lottia gigantea]
MTTGYMYGESQDSRMYEEILSINLTLEKNVSHEDKTEGAILFMVAIIAGFGNLCIVGAIMTIKKFRKTSSAFLCHHCILDFLKSLFCIPFGYSLLMDTDIQECNIVGASYIFLMTVSAYNLLALLMNEEYHIMDTTNKIKGNYCCVMFGIFMIWFTTILLHLGVAFIPGSTEFNDNIGNCVFTYGVPSNYVIHVLWILLVSGAVILSVVTFTTFYRKLQCESKVKQWKMIHKSMSHEMNDDGEDEELHFEFDDISSTKAVEHARIYMRRITLMVLMVGTFVLFWYPLFLLTLFDKDFKQSAKTYRYLTVFAWSQPITTPVFCSIIYYDVLNRQTLVREVYSNAIPLKPSHSKEVIRQKIQKRYKAYDTGFRNEHYQSHQAEVLTNCLSEIQDLDSNSNSDNETLVTYDNSLRRNVPHQTLIL